MSEDTHPIAVEFGRRTRVARLGAGALLFDEGEELLGRLRFDPMGGDADGEGARWFGVEFEFEREGKAFRYRDVVTAWDLRFRDGAPVAWMWPGFEVHAGPARARLGGRPLGYFLPNGQRRSVNPSEVVLGFEVMLDRRYAVVRCAMGSAQGAEAVLVYYVRQYTDLLLQPAARTLLDPWGEPAGHDEYCEPWVELEVLGTGVQG